MYSENDRISATAKYALVVLLIAIFEGAIRKWLSSGLGSILIGVRDVLTVISIIVAFVEKPNISHSILFKLVVVWCFFVISWGLIQVFINQTPFLLFIVGIRFWLLYFVFAVSIGLSISERDFDYIVYSLFFVAVLMMPLIVVQHLLPPSHFINKQIENNSERIFVVANDIVRTTGTFSFTLGQTTFLGLLTPLVLGYITNSNNKRTILTWGALISVVVCTILSGSRGAILLFFSVFAIYILFEFILLKKILTKSHGILIVVIMLGVVLSPVIFSRAIDATQERFESASESESMSDRILSTFAGEPFVIDSMSWTGSGIGNGSNFAAIFLTGDNGFMLAETEPGRNLLEGGLLGVVFVIIKWLLFFLSGFVSVVLSMKNRDCMYILLCLLTFIAVLTWSVTGQITANVLGNFLVLFLVAKFSFHKINFE